MNDPGEYERRLEDILCADDPAAAFEQSELASSTEARAEFDELMAARSRIERVGELERDELAEAPASTEPGGERALEALRAEIEGGLADAAPAGPRILGPLVGVAAALALLFGVLQWSKKDDPGPELGGPLQIVRPAGAVEAYAPFEWTGELPEAGWYRVFVHDAEASGAAPLAESDRLPDPSWSPAASAIQDWPARIRWTVRAFDPSNARDPMAEASAEANLESP